MPENIQTSQCAANPPGPNPSSTTRCSLRPEDELFEIWKVAEPWERPLIEQRLLRYFRQHAAKVCWMILHTRDPELVEEISVDALLDLADFKGLSAFSTWFHARAKYRCIDVLRQRISRNEVQLDGLMGTLGRIGNVESDYSVREMLASLTEEERNLVFLKVYDGCSDADIAETMGVSRQKVQWMWSRLRKYLRDWYGGKTIE